METGNGNHFCQEENRKSYRDSDHEARKKTKSAKHTLEVNIWKEKMRKRLYQFIENTSFYSLFMIAAIVVSIVPLAFKTQAPWMECVDLVTVTIFIIDYLARWITADIKRGGAISFVKYPFGFMAIIDLLSILPSITPINAGYKLLKLFRLIRSFRVFRVFKIFRYSKSISMIIAVFRKQKETLLTIFGIAAGYVVISALLILNVEPDTFENFFEALYWATISLTTVGYGDIYPVSVAGKIITMISSVLGIAIVALPAGTITAGMMEEISAQKKGEC